MIVGVIGSGSIGPDLAYGFLSAIGASGGKVFLHDIQKDALDRGMARIEGYLSKAVARGKLDAARADKLRANIVPTLTLGELAGCEYVLEAATEQLPVKRAILERLETVVSSDCLIGFATSGIPRARIAETARHPDRCFVNHPFFPAWRALPIEVVCSANAALADRMVATLRTLGKVPIVTADVVCFAADDIFCNYCAEAARLVVEGVATPAEIDQVVDEAVGGGGPLAVTDLTKGNLLHVHCLELMRDAPTGSPWFTPPAAFTERGNRPWHEPGAQRRAQPTAEVAKVIRDRILAVLFARTLFVVENDICDASDLDWMTRNALGFRKGLLEFAGELGPSAVRDIVSRFAAKNPGFHVPKCVTEERPVTYLRDVVVTRERELAVVNVRRPEVRNALCAHTMRELAAAMRELEADASVKGVLLTSDDGALAGADIQELAGLANAEECERLSRNGQDVLGVIAGLSKPVVAAVDGPVMGGGAELCMACHGRVVGKRLAFAQPEVNLGIIPGYGGTQRLPRLIGVERAARLLRTGEVLGANDAHAWGFAAMAPEADFRGAAKQLLRRAIAGELSLRPVDPRPVEVPKQFAEIDLGHRSLAIDAILVDVLREGLRRPLPEGLALEAKGFGRCKETVDMDIGMKNFMQNGPRVPAEFLHE